MFSCAAGALTPHLHFVAHWHSNILLHVNLGTALSCSCSITQNKLCMIDLTVLRWNPIHDLKTCFSPPFEMPPFADMQPEQVAKVRGDLGVTQQNMAVFSEMLSELKPGLEHPEVSEYAPKLSAIV